MACYTLMASRQGRIRRTSVDEGLAVSSGLLDLVVVLGNDVEEHRLEEQEGRGEGGGKQNKSSVETWGERGGGVEEEEKGVVSSSLRCFCVRNASFHHHLRRLAH